MRSTKIMMVALIAMLVTAASAFAAGKPTVATGGHRALTPTSVTLLGKVNPQSILTSYFFQYGTTKAYGIQSGPVAAGSGTKAVNATAAVIGLTPHTTYHYRLVAINNAGTTLGADASFATPKQPLGLSLLATPNPAPFGGPTTVNATLTGTDNVGRTVVLRQRPFPYTAAFAVVGNPELTNTTGIASFPILSLGLNTQYQAIISGTSVGSPILTVGSAVIVHLNQSSRHVHSGSLAAFSGTVSPVEDGALYAIQKLKGTAWAGITGSSLHHNSSSSSKFSIHVRIRHSGVYRVYVGVADGSHQSSSSASVSLKVIPRHHR